MSPSEIAGVALEKLRTVVRKTDGQAEPATLASPTFLEQEPDLIKENGLHNRQTSGWAAGGGSE